MKKHILLSFAAIATFALLMPACTPNAPSQDKLFVNESQVADIIKDGKLYNINDFLAEFMSEKGDFENYRTRTTKDGKIFLFSIDTIATDTIGIYLRGRIATDDYGGNFYKSLVIQQVTDWNTGEAIEQQALRLSVDMGSASGLYHQGQEVLIRCNGLAIGRYANQPQLCTPSYNNNVYAGGKAAEKVGWAPGRIPSPRFRLACTLIGKPDVSKLQYEEMTLAQFEAKYRSKYNDVQGARIADGRLLRLTGVHFTGQYDNYGSPSPCTTYDPERSLTVGNPEEDGNASVFGPTTGNVGYPQSRYISDDNKNMTLVSTSEYAKYAYYYLPDAKYVGSVVGILGYYYDNAQYDPDGGEWSVTPNNINDILPDTEWVPREWSKNEPQ